MPISAAFSIWALLPPSAAAGPAAYHSDADFAWQPTSAPRRRWCVAAADRRGGERNATIPSSLASS